MLVQRERGPLRSARGQRGRSHQTWQYFVLHDALVEQRAEKRNLRLARDLYAVQLVLQRINDDQNVAELRRDDVSAIIAPVLRPDYVDFVVAEVPGLQSDNSTAFLVSITRDRVTQGKFYGRLHPRKHYLLQQALGTVRRHPRGNVEENLGEGRSVVRRSDAGCFPGYQPAEEASVRLQLDLPGESGDETLVLLTGSDVA